MLLQETVCWLLRLLPTYAGDGFTGFALGHAATSCCWRGQPLGDDSCNQVTARFKAAIAMRCHYYSQQMFIITISARWLVG